MSKGTIVLVVSCLLLWPTCAGTQQIDTRHAKTVRAFMKATGYPKGRPGWIVDHVVPICAGAPDTIANLQWQTKAESYVKDKYERALCRAMRAQGLILVKLPPAVAWKEP